MWSPMPPAHGWTRVRVSVESVAVSGAQAGMATAATSLRSGRVGSAILLALILIALLAPWLANADPAKLLIVKWLLGLDSNQQPSG